jgi:hypothetical protein
MKIAAAFVAAKRGFSPAIKTETNSHFKNKYADLSVCLEAVNGALLENGIAVYQETFDVQDGVTVETCFLHESGEMLRMGKLHVPASKHDPQGYGSALTYARRFSLMAACGIAAVGEDDDGNAGSKKPIPKPEGKPVNPLDAVVQKVTAESAESVAEPSPKQIEYDDGAGGSWLLRLPNITEPKSISPDQESWLNEFNALADSVMKSGKLPPAQRIEKLKQLRQANETEVARLVMMDKAKFLQTYSQRIGALDALAKAAA